MTNFTKTRTIVESNIMFIVHVKIQKFGLKKSLTNVMGHNMENYKIIELWQEKYNFKLRK